MRFIWTLKWRWSQIIWKVKVSDITWDHNVIWLGISIPHELICIPVCHWKKSNCFQVNVYFSYTMCSYHIISVHLCACIRHNSSCLPIFDLFYWTQTQLNQSTSNQILLDQTAYDWLLQNVPSLYMTKVVSTINDKSHFKTEASQLFTSTSLSNTPKQLGWN